MNLFVGNLPFGASEEALRDLFVPFGEVQQVRIMTDRVTGKSRGFAFVEMAQEDAEKAMASLNGKDFGGRALTVNEARPRPERSGGFGSGGGFGGKHRGGGGGGRKNSRGGGRPSRDNRW